MNKCDYIEGNLVLSWREVLVSRKEIHFNILDKLMKSTENGANDRNCAVIFLDSLKSMDCLIENPFSKWAYASSEVVYKVVYSQVNLLEPLRNYLNRLQYPLTGFQEMQCIDHQSTRTVEKDLLLSRWVYVNTVHTFSHQLSKFLN